MVVAQRLPAAEAQRAYAIDKRRLVAMAIAAAVKAWADSGVRGRENLANAVAGLQYLLVGRALQALNDGLEEQGIEAPPAATVAAESLSGISMYGMPLVERLGYANSESQLIRATLTEMADTGRVATGLGIAVRPTLEGYIRFLNPPSCARCAVLAGKVYRWSTGFDRHDNCDCDMVPVSDMSEVPDSALFSAEEAFKAGEIGTWREREDGSRRWEPGLSQADAQAIEDGADMSSVVNVRRRAAGLKVAGYTMTRPATRRERTMAGGYGEKWMPEAIYRMARGDRDEALRLLLKYGYIR